MAVNAGSRIALKPRPWRSANRRFAHHASQRSWDHQHLATLFLLADLAAVVSALPAGFLVARAASSIGGGRLSPASLLDGPWQTTLAELVLTLGGAGLVLFMLGQYRSRVPRWTETRRLVLAGFAAMAIDATLDTLRQDSSQSLSLVLFWLFCPALALLYRQLVRTALLRAGRWLVPAVVVGDGECARRATAMLGSQPGLGYEVVGSASTVSLAALRGEGRWQPVMERLGARLLVLAFDAPQPPRREFLDSLARQKVPFALVSPREGLPATGGEQVRFPGYDAVMVSYSSSMAQPFARFLKGVFDVAAASVLLLLLSPLLLLITLLIKRDGGPAFFSHPRLGRNGAEFGCLKFRSMVTDSAAVLQHLLDTDPAARREWDETQKLRNDPRVTAVGRFLRETSLDELPQLFNVLRLEMSLVGPRPIVRQEVPRYGENIASYYETRPGLTGLWQISGRNDTSYDQRVDLDCHYVWNWTLWQDFSILARTVPAVLKRRGAC